MVIDQDGQLLKTEIVTLKQKIDNSSYHKILFLEISLTKNLKCSHYINNKNNITRKKINKSILVSH